MIFKNTLTTSASNSQQFNAVTLTDNIDALRLNRACDIVMRHGWNATAYQIINPGISLWFSKTCDAVVGYVEHNNVRVVAGAPVCAQTNLAQVAAEFERDASSLHKRVCYFGAEARMETLYNDSPSHSKILLGAQPVWSPQNWPQTISRHASLRAQLNRARNKSVVINEWDSEHATEHPELKRCLHEWLDSRTLPPLHFLVEPETLAHLEHRRIFVAEQMGAVVGFLIASPIPQRNGWLIEQTIRGRNAPNGTAELLIDAAIRTMAKENFDYVTLGLAPLSKRAEVNVDDNPLFLKVMLTWVRAHGRRFYNFDGLDAFKAKFRPERWEAVYAISNERSFSLLTLYAIAGAFTDQSPVITIARAVKKALRIELKHLASFVQSFI